MIGPAKGRAEGEGGGGREEGDAWGGIGVGGEVREIEGRGARRHG